MREGKLRLLRQTGVELARAAEAVLGERVRYADVEALMDLAPAIDRAVDGADVADLGHVLCLSVWRQLRHAALATVGGLAEHKAFHRAHARLLLAKLREDLGQLGGVGNLSSAIAGTARPGKSSSCEAGDSRPGDGAGRDCYDAVTGARLID